MSAFPGDTINFFIAATHAVVNPVNIQVAQRNGLVVSQSRTNASPVTLSEEVYAQGCSNILQPIPFTIPSNWNSGVYVATFTDSAAPTPNSGELFFVVRGRPRSPQPQAVVVIPLATLQAYNFWGGASLYLGPTQATGYIHNWDGLQYAHFSHQVAVDRPGQGWANDINQADKCVATYPAFDSCTDLFGAMDFIESELGQSQVDYATSIDLHNDSSLLPAYNLMVSIGHDEYWSKEMRDNVENFVRWCAGNVCFFGANTAWWQVRFENRAANGTLITASDSSKIVCYKMDGQPVGCSGYDYSKDPMWWVDQSLITTHWHAPTVNRPENKLTGVSYRNGAYYDTNGISGSKTGYSVQYPQHWAFRRPQSGAGQTFYTGLVFGNVDELGATSDKSLFDISPEWDAADLKPNTLTPEASGLDGSPLNFLPLATCVGGTNPYTAQAPGLATMGLFRNNGVVFHAGILGWRYALVTNWNSAKPSIKDTAASQISSNVLQRLRRKGPFKYEQELQNAYFESWTTNGGSTVPQPNNWTVTGGGPLGIACVTEGGIAPPTGNNSLNVDARQGLVRITSQSWLSGERYTNYQLGVVVKSSAPGVVVLYFLTAAGHKFLIGRNTGSGVWETIMTLDQMNLDGPMWEGNVIMEVSSGATAYLSDVAMWEMPTNAMFASTAYTK